MASSSSSSSSGSDISGDSRVAEWELGLPTADDLTPLSHSLISPFLAAAFSIPSVVDLSVGDDDEARPAKRPRRLMWTPHLHKRFLAVVAHLGVMEAVPSAIVQMMNVEGLTRANVASHLQKYRLFIKRFCADPDPDPPPHVLTAPYGFNCAYNGS